MSTFARENVIYPSLSQEIGIKKRNYNVQSREDDAVDVALNDPGLTPNEINSVIYKNDFKKFRENLSKDVSKYHSLEARYGKIISLCLFSLELNRSCLEEVMMFD